MSLEMILPKAPANSWMRHFFEAADPPQQDILMNTESSPSDQPATNSAGAYSPESYASKFLPERSIYQDDRRIFHRGEYRYETIERWTDLAVADNHEIVLHAALSWGGQATLRLAWLKHGTLRLRWALDEMTVWNEESPLPAASPALADWPQMPRADEHGWAVDLGRHRLIVPRQPAGLVIQTHEGREVFRLETEQIAGQPVAPPLGFRRAGDGSIEPFLSFRIRNDERLFGLGEKWNRVEKTGSRATVWASDTCGSNTTDLSYKSLPLLFSTRGWGLMLHSTWRSFWEIGCWSYTAGSCLTEEPKLEAFLFLDPTLKGLIGLYTELTGRPPLPPLWALGTWMSRCMYEKQSEAEEVMDRLRKERIPCDVIHLDPLWMKTHYYWKIGVDACDFVRNEAGFPDLPGLWRRWAENGFATCLWVNPYLPEGSPIYAEAAERGYLLKRVGGGLARLSHGEPVGMVDFTNREARRWWKNHLRKQLREGAAVLKPDYGDRVPEDALAADGRTGREIHNLYLFLFAQVCFEAALEERGEGFVWRRAGFLGAQRYPGTWAGDTQVTWEALRCCLRGGLSASLSGEAFWASDIGGFVGPAPAPDLYIRWAQLGFLSGLTRFHGTTPREPWHYGEEAVEAVRRYSNLRYSLIPYLMGAALEANRYGWPLMRPMILEFPDEPGVETIEDQYLLGSEILVAPVLLPGATRRAVYFPAGEWRHLEIESMAFHGPRYHWVEAPLERLPVFVRQGAVLARYIHNPQHLKGPPPAMAGLDIFPGDSMRHGSIPWGQELLEWDYQSSGAHGRLTIHPIPLRIHVRLVGRVAAELHSDMADLHWAGRGETVISFDATDGGMLEFS